MPRRRPVRSRVGVLAALAFLLAACTTATIDGHGSTGRHSPSSSIVSSSGAGPTTADFHDCKAAFQLNPKAFPRKRVDKLAIGCATVPVPLDYAKPAGRTIAIQLVRVHFADDHHPIGQLLVNPGGPGESGVLLAVDLAAQVSDTVLQHFDLLGFDPRGVGFSSPIRCLSDAQKDALNAASPDVLTTAGFAAAKREATMFARACSSKYGSALADYDTVQTAQDMDRIRAAVGDSRLNYLGFSYGTELGGVYAHLFPSHVRAMVLDGAVDPLTSDLASSSAQLRGFESAFDQFAQYCRVHSPCRNLGDPRAAVAKVIAVAKQAPIPSSKPGERRRATTSIVYTAILSALYSQSNWPKLGTALQQAEGGDSAGLFALADQYNRRINGHYTNIDDANSTIGCNDSRPGPSDATIRATAKRWAAQFPIFGLWSASSLFVCQQWQPHRSPPPKPTAPTPHPVLVIGNLHDPATPYQGAKDLARTMGHAVLLTWDGEGHTSYLQGSACVDRAVERYLIAGTPPPAGTVCPR